MEFLMIFILSVCTFFGDVYNSADILSQDVNFSYLRVDPQDARNDIGIVLSGSCTEELAYIISKIESGEIDGGTYRYSVNVRGEEEKIFTPACLLGTMARYRKLPSVHDMVYVKADQDSPAEILFSHIRPGDTPWNNRASLYAYLVIRRIYENKKKKREILSSMFCEK